VGAGGGLDDLARGLAERFAVFRFKRAQRAARLGRLGNDVLG
jgi:hypothetical protein